MWQAKPATEQVVSGQGCFVGTERNDHIPTTGLMQR